MSTPLMPTLRKITFAAVIVCSLIVLPLSAHVTNLWQRAFGFYLAFSALGLATALLTLLTLPAMLFLDNMRKDVVTSRIVVEVGWLGFLWILWLSSAARASQVGIIFTFGGCGGSSICNEVRAIQAFTWLGWLAIFGYLATLLMFTVRLASRGYNRVWFQSVRDTEFNAPPVANYQGTGVTQVVYPPQQGPTGQWAGQQQQQQGAQGV